MTGRDEDDARETSEGASFAPAAAERGVNPPPTLQPLRGDVEAEKGSSQETKRARHFAFSRSLDSVWLFAIQKIHLRRIR